MPSYILMTKDLLRHVCCHKRKQHECLDLLFNQIDWLDLSDNMKLQLTYLLSSQARFFELLKTNSAIATFLILQDSWTAVSPLNKIIFRHIFYISIDYHQCSEYPHLLQLWSKLRLQTHYFLVSPCVKFVDKILISSWTTILLKNCCLFLPKLII